MTDTLHLLEGDTARLLLAGTASCQGDPGLRTRKEALAPLVAAAPALARLAQQADNALAGGPAELLDLAAMTAQIRGTRARPADGSADLVDLPATENLTSFLPPHEIELLYYTLHRRRRGMTEVPIKDSDMRKMVKDAAQTGAARDTRLLPLWLENLTDRTIGEIIRDKVVPLLGEAAARPIAARLNLQGDAADTMLLGCLVSLRGRATRDLLLQALDSGSPVMQEAALDALDKVDPAAARPFALARLQQAGPRDAGGVAAVRIVARMKSDEALEALLTALQASNQIALQALRTHKHPRATTRLLDLLTPDPLPLPATTWVLAALGPRGDRSALPRLLELWRAGSPPRPALATTLLQLNAPEGLEAVVQCLDDTDPHVREFALQAALQLGPDAAYERLSPCLALDRLHDADGLAMAHRILQSISYPSNRVVDPRWLDTWRQLTAEDLGQSLWQIQSGAWRMAWEALVKQGGAAFFEGSAWLFSPSALARSEAAASASSLIQRLDESGKPIDPRWFDRLLGLLEDQKSPFSASLRASIEHALMQVVASPGPVPAAMLRRALHALQPGSQYRHKTLVMLACRFAGLPIPTDPASPDALKDAIAAISSSDPALAQVMTAQFLAVPQQHIRQTAATSLADNAGPGTVASLLASPESSPEIWESARQALQEMQHEVVGAVFDKLPPDAASQFARDDLLPGWKDRNRSRVSELLLLLLARTEEVRREPRAQAFLILTWNSHAVPEVRHTAGVALLRLEDLTCMEALVGDTHYTGHDFAKPGYRAVVILALRHVGNLDPAHTFELAAPLYRPDRLAIPGGKSLAAETLQSFLPEPHMDPRNDPYSGWRPPTWTVYGGNMNYEIPAYPEMKGDPRWYDRCAEFLQDAQVCQGLLAGDGDGNSVHRLGVLLQILSETGNRKLTPVILNGLDILLAHGEQSVAQLALGCVDQLHDPATIVKIQEWQTEGRLGGSADGGGKTAADYLIEKLRSAAPTPYSGYRPSS